MRLLAPENFEISRKHFKLPFVKLLFAHGFPDNILHCTALVSASVEIRNLLAESCKNVM